MRKIIHSRVPKKLIKALQNADGNERELARRLGVNILYISQLLKSGIEPTDKTELGRSIRVKLFLPKRKQKTGPEQEPIPAWKQKIRREIAKMAKITRQAVFFKNG